MTAVYFDTRYNKCSILFTNANLVMNDVLTCQLIGMGVTTKPYVIIWNRNTPLCQSYENTEKRKS